jgi:hypothetical protein
MKSWKKPTPEAVDQALASAPRAEQLQYFFSKLENPEWLDPLAERKFFSSPLSPIVHEDGSISFPFWPQAQYLVRIAALVPDKVVAVIKNIPETENFRVHESFIEGALAIPAQKATELTRNVLLWFGAKFGSHLGRSLAKLVSHLAKGGQIEAALTVCRSLLDFTADPKFEKKEAQQGTPLMRRPLEPLARIEAWRYQRVLKNHLPDLLAVAPVETIDLLTSVLERLIELSSFDAKKQKPVDHSVLWRPAIESHRENWGRSIKDYLVSALRTGSESAIVSGADFGAVEDILTKRKWDIFERLRMHLVRMFPDKAGARVARILTDKEAFENISYRHEYSKLLSEQFKNLSNQQQQLILGWIAMGPDPAEREAQGGTMSDEDWEQYVKYWTARKLKPIEKDLPREWADKFIRLVEEVGQPTHYDTVISHGPITIGSESPKRFEELSSMSIDQLVEYMARWTPSNDFRGPSADGLAHVFGKVVTANAKRFSESADSFKKSEATYVRALISGLSEAVKSGQQLVWPPLLKLFESVLNISDDTDEPRTRKRTSGGHDPDWSWVRRSIAGFLRSALQEGAGEAPITSRTSIWPILAKLAKDSDPTPDHEARSSLDAATLSINSCRGEALHAVVEHALWVFRHEKDAAQRGFGAMPEVQALLEEHLNTETEPSFAIRTIYGQYFPWLHLIDPRWAADNVLRIFPLTPENRRYFDAAWQIYVLFNSAYDSVFDVLQDQYRFAIELIPREGKIDERLANSAERLAEHLMALYWRGQIDFQSPTGHLALFFETAPGELRGHALAYVGQTAGRTKEPIQLDLLQRLMKLWEWRLKKIEEADQESGFENELSAFSWWFSCGKFDRRWTAAQLLKVLSTIKTLPDDFLVMEQLAILSAELPLEAVQILKMMAEGIPEQRWWYPEDEHVKTVLRNALELNNEETQRTAREARDILLSFGYFQFREVDEGSAASN